MSFTKTQVAKGDQWELLEDDIGELFFRFPWGDEGMFSGKTTVRIPRAAIEQIVARHLAGEHNVEEILEAGDD